MKLIPIDVDTPQAQLMEALASLLVDEGVPDMFCGPVAIDIMAGIQMFIDGNTEEAIEFLTR